MSQQTDVPAADVPNYVKRAIQLGASKIDMVDLGNGSWRITVT